LRDEYLVEIGGTVSLEVAKKVLHAFSELVGKKYTLEDVDVVLKQSDEKGKVQP
jgi:hypothetical protein